MADNKPQPWNEFPVDNQQKRVQVLDADGKLLSPTKVSRARRWLRTEKAKIVRNAQGELCVQLVKKISIRYPQLDNYEDNLIIYATLFKWLFWLALTVVFIIDQKRNIFDSLGAECFAAWIIGLIRTSLVIRFGLPENRLSVTLIYLPLACILAVISSL